MVLTVNSLSKTYGTITALKNFYMTVEEGNVIGILGPNGSGKTTLLSILVGLRKADSGHFKWFNQKANELCNSRIGALVESPYLYQHLSVRDNLNITATAKGLTESDVNNALNKVNLLEKSGLKCCTLSLGMKQRLAIAQAIIGNPEVLILDEPTNGLDPVGIADIRNIIKHESEDGKTIIVASHNLDEVQKICSHVVILKDGCDIEFGKVDYLLKLKHIATLTTDQTIEAENVIKSIANITISEKNRTSITVTFDSNSELNAMNEALLHNNIVITGLETRQPTLEELFIDIIKQK